VVLHQPDSLGEPYGLTRHADPLAPGNPAKKRMGMISPSPVHFPRKKRVGRRGVTVSFMMPQPLACVGAITQHEAGEAASAAYGWSAAAYADGRALRKVQASRGRTSLSLAASGRLQGRRASAEARCSAAAAFAAVWRSDDEENGSPDSARAADRQTNLRRKQPLRRSQPTSGAEV
jgi:hypothetical protein